MARNGIYLARAREQIAQQRAENEREHRRRVDDAYRRVPGLRALDQTLQQQMITLVGLTMRHGSDPTDELRALERANLDTQAQRAELLTALPAGGVVGVLECATHSGDAAQVLELAHAAPYFHAALGIHPESLIEEDAATVAVYHGDWRAELAAMRPLFADKAVAAVGEIGLDHHWPVPRQEQYDLFEAQLQLAKELDLPVSAHDREAHVEMYELLRKYKPRGALHCYSGSADDAAWLVEQGMYLGFGGAVTYKGAKRAARVLAAIPHDRALLETDCPYMAPEPVRGTRNDSRNIVHVAAYIGTLWDMDAQAVLDQTAANARACFGV